MEGKIHFLNTGHSDCIILESCGKIADWFGGRYRLSER